MRWFIPPIFVLISLVAMVALRLGGANTHLVVAPYNLAGVVLAVIGIGLAVAGSRQIDRAQTEINTFGQPRQLVTAGLFRFTRNPMYLGFLDLLLGTALALNSAYALVPALAFFAPAQFWYIPFEERRMVQTFGPAYDAYRHRVRRWI